MTEDLTLRKNQTSGEANEGNTIASIAPEQQQQAIEQPELCTNPVVTDTATLTDGTSQNIEHEKKTKSRSKGKRLLIDWRRNYVWELRAKGYSVKQIVDELCKNNTNLLISERTVRKDISLKLYEIESRFAQYVEKDLVKEHHLAKTGLESVLQSAWVIFNSEGDNERRLSALRVINETYALLQKLTGDPDIVKEAIAYANKSKKKVVAIG